MIRIGAVNCQEEWSLCQRQGIQSYPSLVLYPTVSSKLASSSLSNYIVIYLLVNHYSSASQRTNNCIFIVSTQGGCQSIWGGVGST